MVQLGIYIYIFPIVRPEFRQIPLVALVVWDLSQHVLHPGPRVNIGSLAGAYERIYDCRTIRRCVIATEQIVAPAESQRSDGILNEIVVNVDAPVVHIARQPGQQGVCVFDRITHLAVGKNLQICLFHPCLKEPYCRIRYLQALFLALIRSMVITNAILDNLTAQAKASSRLRCNLDLRNSPEDGSQRMLNAIEPGSPLPIHRHKYTSETVVCLRGRFVEEFYDELARVCIDAIELTPGGPNFLVNVPAGQWHTVRALESGSVLLEMKDGKYEPLGPEDILSL